MPLLCVQNDHAVIVCTEWPCCYCVQNAHAVIVYRMLMLLLCTEWPYCYCVQNNHAGIVCTDWWCYKFSQWWCRHRSPWGDPTQLTGRNPGTNWVPVSKSTPTSLMQAPLTNWYMYCPQLCFSFGCFFLLLSLQILFSSFSPVYFICLWYCEMLVTVFVKLKNDKKTKKSRPFNKKVQT